MIADSEVTDMNGLKLAILVYLRLEAFNLTFLNNVEIISNFSHVKDYLIQIIISRFQTINKL